MITFAKVKDAVLSNLKRILKVEQFGVKTASESSPFGLDSVPLKNMTAIYSDTSNNSESVILGYINESQLALPGEFRIYSLDSNKNLKSFIWLKVDGSIEINGSSNFAVKYTELQSALSLLSTNINTENTKIAAAISLLGGSYIPNPINIDITLAKNETIKTN